MTLPISDYDYELPEELIAQTPCEPRDHSRLLVLDRHTGQIQHRHFYDIAEYLQPGDVLVANNSRVLPARLYGKKASGGAIEALLLRQIDPTRWEALIKGKVRQGSLLTFAHPQYAQINATAQVTELHAGGTRTLQFSEPLDEQLQQLGVMPLPPYITQTLDDPERYQTVYSATVGSAAAPTAGLHWTPELIQRVQAQGVTWADVTLHVGLDTFRPVQVENALEHAMHNEWYYLPPETAQAINHARTYGGRIIAVGTTSVRVLETIGRNQIDQPTLAAESGWTDIYIHPPYRWTVVNGLITNFHLPRSTLLLLVSAFTSRDIMLQTYATAVKERYRFFSFGDAMFII